MRATRCIIFNLGYALWKKGEFASAAESFRADAGARSGRRHGDYAAGAMPEETGAPQRRCGRCPAGGTGAGEDGAAGAGLPAAQVVTGVAGAGVAGIVASLGAVPFRAALLKAKPVEQIPYRAWRGFHRTELPSLSRGREL